MAESLFTAIAGRKWQVRPYPTVAGPAEPAALIGRLAREGVRLRRSGPVLLAVMPKVVPAARCWPALDLLLRRHTASLAVTVDLARQLAEGLTPERIAALLTELSAEVPGIVRETVCGEERLRMLLGSPLAGADLDLACVACWRGLAIRELSRGRAGSSGDREVDESDRERRYAAARAPTPWNEPAAALLGRRSARAALDGR
jgi:hypothetical protein